MALPTLQNIKAYLQGVSNLRETVKAAKQYFAGENDFLTALVAYYLDQGGGGGGGGTINATTSKLVSQTATAGQSVTLTIPVPSTTGERNILTYINAGYHGAAFPANAVGVLSVDMGVDTLVFPGITSAGPAPLYQLDSGLQADINSTVVLTLPSIPNLIPTITVGYRTGPQ